MKAQHIVGILSLLLLLNFSTRTLIHPASIKSESAIDTLVTGSFIITKIDSVQDLYVIYAKQNELIYKIISKKDLKTNCRNIVANCAYDLTLKSILENVASKRHIGGMKYEKVLIKMESDPIVWDLFTSKNIVGKCYIPNIP